MSEFNSFEEKKCSPEVRQLTAPGKWQVGDG